MSGTPSRRPSLLFEKTAQWFDRSNAALLGSLPCCQGCSHCCVGLFPVTILDRAEVQRGLATLSSDRRRAIEQRAAEQVTALTAVAPELVKNCFLEEWPDRDIDRLTEHFNALPCPALEQSGACAIYEFRPLACRSMGVPSDDNGQVNGACAVQTAVPLIRPSKILREEETQLARLEAEQLKMLRDRQGVEGEELFLPYAFVSDAQAARATDPT